MIAYEWDVEEVDAHEDIVDHNFCDSLKPLLEHYGSAITAGNGTFRLVLVRDVGNDVDGLIDRHWAYVRNGKLPQFFSDGIADTGHRVPARFHRELKG
jgi:hypothetical protein